MFRRGMLFILAIGAAAGVPYFANQWGRLKQAIGANSPAAATGQANPASRGPQQHATRRRRSHDRRPVSNLGPASDR